MAKIHTRAEFDMLMDKVEKVDIRVKKYLELAGYEKWARLYASVNRGWIMTSNIAKSINSTLVKAMQLHIFEFLEQVVPTSDYIYSVSDEGKKYIVCLENKRCSCRRFQVDEIPCAHAWAVLKSKNILPDKYCSDLYKPKIILKTYELPVYPLPNITDWNVLSI